MKSEKKYQEKVITKDALVIFGGVIFGLFLVGSFGNISGSLNEGMCFWPPNMAIVSIGDLEFIEAEYEGFAGQNELANITHYDLGVEINNYVEKRLLCEDGKWRASVRPANGDWESFIYEDKNTGEVFDGRNLWGVIVYEQNEQEFFPWIIVEDIFDDGVNWEKQWTKCSNGQLDDDEECDDGNLIDGDGCSMYCELEPTIECYRDEDCGEDKFVSGPYCDGGNVIRKLLSYNCVLPGTFESSCFSEVEPWLVEECEFGCENGKCLEEPKIHDVAIEDFKIKLENVLVVNNILLKDESYQIFIDVLNLGDFAEDVSFNGEIREKPNVVKTFSHIAVSNLAPGEKKDDKYRSVEFDVDFGVYTIFIEALVDVDDNPLNNFIEQKIQVVECLTDDDCGDDEFCNDEYRCEEEDDNGNKKKKKDLIMLGLSCEPLWQCGDWGECVDGVQTRTCEDLKHCENVYNKPSEIQGCAITLKDVEEEVKVLPNYLLWLIVGIAIVFILLIIVLVVRG